MKTSQGFLTHPLFDEWDVPHGFGTRGAPEPDAAELSVRAAEDAAPANVRRQLLGALQLDARRSWRPYIYTRLYTLFEL